MLHKCGIRTSPVASLIAADSVDAVSVVMSLASSSSFCKSARIDVETSPIESKT